MGVLIRSNFLNLLESESLFIPAKDSSHIFLVVLANEIESQMVPKHSAENT